jgi:hypothetical protein
MENIGLGMVLIKDGGYYRCENPECRYSYSAKMKI